MIFFEDDKSFSLEVIPLKTEDTLTCSFWIVLAGINETPPHIALIANGKYYSLSTRKVDCGSPLEKLMNAIRRKQIPTLFFQFRTLDAADKNFELLQNIYKDLLPLGNDENTCLSPIKDFFAGYYSDEFKHVNYVFELLALAENKGLLKECVSLFYENTNSNIITLPKYSMTQIKNRIKSLSTPINTLK